jgi:hypothetical protein
MRRRHGHAPREVAVWYPPSLAAAMLAAPQVTIVLKRCSCGDLDTVMLAGKWTLAQVRGDVAAAPAQVPALP